MPIPDDNPFKETIQELRSDGMTNKEVYDYLQEVCTILQNRVEAEMAREIPAVRVWFENDEDAQKIIDGPHAIEDHEEPEDVVERLEDQVGPIKDWEETTKVVY